MSATLSAASVQLKLNSQVICPSCWHRFPPEKILWVATNPELLGDSKLGEHAYIRFLPTSFDIQGNAVDMGGTPCSELACPRCHLVVPRPNIEIKPMFVSIAGTPSCGKSYFLASMTWQLRQNLPERFKVSISDADPSCNAILNDYEEQQFFNSNRDTPVRLKKTEEQGDDYASTLIEGNVVQCTKPFLFAVRPINGHPNEEKGREISRLLCLYDNAGESFAPGRDNASNPVTRHLAQAAAICFCFDPLQDPRIRHRLDGKTDDIQVTESSVTARQEIVFHEIADRFRRFTGMPQSEKTNRPVLVIVTKYDGWRKLLPIEELPSPYKQREDGLHALDLNTVGMVSDHVRGFLRSISAELVSSVEAFSNHVWFIPVSATGRAPERDPATGIVGVRPRDVNPLWCDVPVQLVLSQVGHGLIPVIPRKAARPQLASYRSEPDFAHDNKNSPDNGCKSE